MQDTNYSDCHIKGKHYHIVAGSNQVVTHAPNGANLAVQK